MVVSGVGVVGVLRKHYTRGRGGAWRLLRQQAADFKNGNQRRVGCAAVVGHNLFYF